MSRPPAGTGEPSAPGRDVDFDLHGFVGLRIIDATARDVETITRQIGPLVGPLSTEPDITVRFVDELPLGTMTYAGWPESAATKEGFVLLRGKDGAMGRTLLPMAAVGGRCDIVCERRSGHVPHLLAVLNMTALTKGVLPLHASAFEYEGIGVLATGWAKGGKTETLLAFAAHGANYVGDEWVYLTPDGGMHGVPEPIRLWHWHVEQLPAVRASLSASSRTRLSALSSISDGAASLGTTLAGLPASVARRLAPLLRRQAYVQVPPAQLFGEAAIALHGRLDQLFLVQSHDSDAVVVERASGSSIAATMAASLEEERSPFLQAYRQFRFLYPDQRSAVVEAAGGIEIELLDRYLADRPSHVLRHPYPVRFETLVGPLLAAIREQQ